MMTEAKVISESGADIKVLVTRHDGKKIIVLVPAEDKYLWEENEPAEYGLNLVTNGHYY